MSEIDDFKKLLRNHEQRISKLEKSSKPQSKTTPITDNRVIQKLLDDGFFDKPKKFGVLIKKLKTQAKYNKKVKYTVILKKFFMPIIYAQYYAYRIYMCKIES